MISDRLLGTTMLSLTILMLIYYFTWTIILPFVEEEQHWFRRLFPDPYWAVATPLMVMVSMMSLAGGTIGVWMIRAKDNNRIGRSTKTTTVTRKTKQH